MARQGESQAALPELGITQDAQTYLALPDTKLVKYRAALTTLIVGHALRHGLHHYFTLGACGFDGHSDHIATHRSALAAQQHLANMGHHVTL